MFFGRIILTDDLILALDGAAIALRPEEAHELSEALDRKARRKVMAQETTQRRSPSEKARREKSRGPRR